MPTWQTSSKSFSVSSSRALQPLELIHSDIWGLASIASKSDFKYYLHFLDDFTRFTWIFPLKTKSKLLAQNFHTLETLKTNWGGEYKPLVKYLNTYDIIFRHLCPHTH